MIFAWGQLQASVSLRKPYSSIPNQIIGSWVLALCRLSSTHTETHTPALGSSVYTVSSTKCHDGNGSAKSIPRLRSITVELMLLSSHSTITKQRSWKQTFLLCSGRYRGLAPCCSGEAVWRCARPRCAERYLGFILFLHIWCWRERVSSKLTVYWRSRKQIKELLENLLNHPLLHEKNVFFLKLFSFKSQRNPGLMKYPLFYSLHDRSSTICHFVHRTWRGASGY